MQAISISQQGTKTDKNEDAFLVLAQQKLFVVADGVGGGPAGDFASRTLVDHIYEGCRSSLVSEQRLVSLIQEAGQAIHKAAEERDLKGMATTFASVLFTPANMVVMHAGDSRIYRIRDNTITMLTNDHSKAVRKPDGSIKLMVTNVLGIRSSANIDINRFDWVSSDQVLLVSDGITDILEDDAILDILSNSNRLLSERVRDLIEESANRGGRDDKTAILVFEQVKNNL